MAAGGGFGGGMMRRRAGGRRCDGETGAACRWRRPRRPRRCRRRRWRHGSRMALAPMRKIAAAHAARRRPAGAPWSSPRCARKFADTALWVGQLTTASNGTAEVELNMPENLTTWRIKVWGMGHGTRVGQGQTDVVTRKDLIVRLEAPRFFVQTDEVVLSANVHNYLKTAKKVEVSLELEGKTLELIPEGSKIVAQAESPSRPAERGPDVQPAGRSAGRRRGPRRLARQGARRRPGHDPHEGPHR